MMTRAGLLIVAMLVIFSSVDAAECFVNKRGADTNDGLNSTNALLTVQKGVSVLQAGDTLAIGPGKYFESVRRDKLGSSEQDAFPGWWNASFSTLTRCWRSITLSCTDRRARR